MDKKLKQLTDKKRQLDAMRPLPQAQIKNLYEWFRVELTYTSNAIEGNTLTRKETALVVEKGLTVQGKSLNDHLEATNHAMALDYVSDIASKTRQELTERELLDIHGLILQGISNEDAGRYRRVAVRIAGTSVVLPNPMKVPELMTEFMTWLTGSNSDHPIKIAADAHYKLVRIHPFVDGNGRTARLLMNLLLIQAGYPLTIIRETERKAYIDALDRIDTTGKFDEFYRLIYDAVDRSFDIYFDRPLEIVEISSEKIKRTDLAKLAGVRWSTIEYYSNIGLLPYEQTEKRRARYYYKDQALARLQEIQKLKDQGLSIEQIKMELKE